MSLVDLIFPSTEMQTTNIEEFDYHKFTPDNWSLLSEREKMDALQELGDSYAESMGIYNHPTFVAETDPSLYGGYRYGTNIISVNLDLCNNPYEAMDTVIHEENHAFQEQVIELNSQYSEGEKALIKAELGPAYYSNGVGYNIQTIEMDSNNAAAEFVINHCKGMQGTLEYQKYIDGRLEYFNGINKTLEVSEEYCNMLEHEQVDVANKTGILNDDEKEIADSYIDSEHRRVRENSVTTGTDVKENRYQSSLEYANKLHMDYEQFAYDAHNENIAKSVLNNNEECVGWLSEAKLAVDKELGDLKAQQNEYICSHNYSIRDTLSDSFCQEQSQKISNLETKKGEYEYHIAELETDNHMVYDSMGWTENSQIGNSREEDKGNGYGM